MIDSYGNERRVSDEKPGWLWQVAAAARGRKMVSIEIGEKIEETDEDSVRQATLSFHFHIFLGGTNKEVISLELGGAPIWKFEFIHKLHCTARKILRLSPNFKFIMNDISC